MVGWEHPCFVYFPSAIDEKFEVICRVIAMLASISLFGCMLLFSECLLVCMGIKCPVVVFASKSTSQKLVYFLYSSIALLVQR